MHTARAWLFDLDGTLVDTAPDLVGAINDMRKARQLPALALNQLRGEASNGARGLLHAGFGLNPEDADFAAAREEFLERYAERNHQKTKLFADIGNLLQALTQAGKRWGIVTNKPIALTRPLISALDLHPEVLLGGDSAPRPKPNPDVLWLACAHLNLPAEECLYFGDAPRDIEAGRAAGMRTVACGWGYVETSPNPANWGADLYARHVSELGMLLK